MYIHIYIHVAKNATSFWERFIIHHNYAAKITN